MHNFNEIVEKYARLNSEYGASRSAQAPLKYCTDADKHASQPMGRTDFLAGVEVSYEIQSCAITVSGPQPGETPGRPRGCGHPARVRTRSMLGHRLEQAGSGYEVTDREARESIGYANARGKKTLPRILAGLPIGRLLPPDDMVGPATFLVSRAAAAVSGALQPPVAALRLECQRQPGAS